MVEDIGHVLTCLLGVQLQRRACYTQDRGGGKIERREEREEGGERGGRKRGGRKRGGRKRGGRKKGGRKRGGRKRGGRKRGVGKYRREEERREEDSLVSRAGGRREMNRARRRKLTCFSWS